MEREALIENLIENGEYQSALELITALVHENPKKTILFLQKLVQHSKTSKDFSHETEGVRLLGYCYTLLGEGIKAFEHFKTALKLAQKQGLEELEQKTLNELGLYYFNTGNYTDALSCWIQVTRFSNERNKGGAYANMSAIYISMDKYDEAIDCYEKALGLFEKHEGFEHATINTFASLATLYIRLANYEKAKDYFYQALDLTEQIEGAFMNASLHAEIYAGLGAIYIQEKNAPEALVVLIKGLSLVVDNDIEDEYLPYYTLLTKAHSLDNNQAEARSYCDLAIFSMGKTTIAKKLVYLKELIAFFDTQKDYEQGYKTLKAYTDTQNSTLDAEKKEALAQLQKAHELAEKEREKQYKAALEEQNIALQKMNEDLRQFTYAVSHDIREPLRMIRAYSGLLIARISEKLNEEEKKLFHFITDGGNRLDSMIQDLLKYATLGKEAIDVEAVDVEKIIYVVLHDLSLKIKEANAEIIIGTLHPVLGNNSYVRQLFQNIVSNAIKFRKPEAPCTISIHSSIQEDAVLYTIQDNGIGIPADKIQHVFGLFRRLRNDYEGTGIGLSLCKKIAEVLDGEIWIKSELDTGTCFYLKLKMPH